MGAVNCAVRRGDKFIGENTDGKGFLKSLQEVVDPAGKAVVMFGAGGAARAIGVELALAGASSITVVNRDPARGQDLVDLLNAKTHGEGRAGRLGRRPSRFPTAPTSWSTPPRSASPRRRRAARPRHRDRSSPAWWSPTSSPIRRARGSSATPRRAAARRSTGSACWSTRASSASSTGPASTSTRR